jgi:hypothetical protein
MKYIIKIKDRSTGEIKEFSDSDDGVTDEQEEHSSDNIIHFKWVENLCDCNIYSDFYGDEEFWPCYEEKFNGERFEILSISREDGKIVYPCS